MFNDDPYFAEAEDKFYDKRISPRVLRIIKHQTGKTNIPVDRTIRAMNPGKRISKNRKIYYEARRNRSDVNPKLKL
jgi:hypothetical protein